MSEYRRVVVTGLGAITPIGNSVAEAWNSMIEGRCGIGEITYFDTTAYKAKLDAEVKNFNARDWMEKADTLRSDRFAQFAIASAVQAVEESGVIGTLPPERVAVYFGSGIGGIQTFTTEHNKLRDRGPGSVSTARMQRFRLSQPVLQVPMQSEKHSGPSDMVMQMQQSQEVRKRLSQKQVLQDS